VNEGSARIRPAGSLVAAILALTAALAQAPVSDLGIEAEARADGGTAPGLT
jgi:hypothetical protein